MGTRAKTSFIKRVNGKREHLVSVYTQYDGYISGLGYDIANYILSKKIVNGFGGGDNSNKANGYECLIAQFIRDFKKDIGGFYITTYDDIQEYNYNIIFDEDMFYSNIDILGDNEKDIDSYFEIEVYNDYDNFKCLYSGNLKGLLEHSE